MDRQQIPSPLYKRFFILIFLSVFCCSFSPPIPGIQYTHKTLPGPLSIHILEIDPTLLEIRLEKAQGYLLSLERLSSIASRTGAIAAINGGFFHGGTYEGGPAGALKINGQWLSSTKQSRAAIGWSAQGKKVWIDRIFTTPSLNIAGVIYPIDCLNQPRGSDQIVLYTWPFYKSTLTEQDGFEMKIDKTDVVRSCLSTKNSSIPLNGSVYSAGPDALSPLPICSKNDLVSLSVTILPLTDPFLYPEWEGCENILGGTPLLVYKNQIVYDYSEEKVRDTFLTRKHPRTAVGVKKDGRWLLVVVDGRQPELSVGMTIKELAEFMASLECEYALNLDGGGSSAMVLGNEVKNSLVEHEDSLFVNVKEQVSDAIIICHPSHQ